MAYTVKETTKIRNKIQNLDPDNNTEDREEYEKVRRNYISVNEGVEPKRYIDSEGNRTIGVGFNLDRNEAINEWNDVFSILPKEERPDFHEAINGDIELTQFQIHLLYDHSVSVRETEIKRVYGELWSELRRNERLVIEDMYFNSRSKKVTINGRRSSQNTLVGQHTNFYNNIKQYVEAKKKFDKTGEEQDRKTMLRHFNDAMWEVKERSAKNKILQPRRNSETELMNSFEFDIEKLLTPDYIIKKNTAVKRAVERARNKLKEAIPSEMDVKKKLKKSLKIIWKILRKPFRVLQVMTS